MEVLDKERYPDPFLRHFTHWISTPLDIDYLNKVSKQLVGQKDFKSFQNTGSSVQNTLCHIFTAYWTKAEGHVEFQIKGQRFLKQMIRNIVGTLLEMERQKLDRECLNQILEARDRQKAYATAPACGLHLKEVIYSDDLQRQCCEI